jgi:TonB family protein
MTEGWKRLEGQVVGGEFHLRQYLGGSDHGAVFLTERGRNEPRKAAIKLIPADSENAELQLSRWRRLARLSHPHLIRLFNAGRCELGGRALLYVVMEYAEEDLSQVLPVRPLAPAEVPDMLRPVLDALAYIHSKGYVHGRIKPSNIMAVADQVKVSTDQLRAVDDSSGRREEPTAYDSPESARRALSPASDVWSIGMTLVQVLTQHLPVKDRAEQKDPVLPESLPVRFRGIARHCLTIDPQRRWTVAEIAAQLQPASLVAEKRTPAGWYEWLAQRRYAILTVAVALALAGMLAGPRVLSRRSDTERTPARVSQPEPRPDAAIQPAPAPTPAPAEAGPPKQIISEQKRPEVTAQASPAIPSAAKTKIPTGGRVQGAVVHQVLPEVPQSARRTIQGKVRVRVRVAVDPSGRVVGTTLDSPGPSKYFARLAVEAARRWEFTPAQIAGQGVPSEWILRFAFGRATTEVFPVQAVP